MKLLTSNSFRSNRTTMLLRMLNRKWIFLLLPLLHWSTASCPQECECPTSTEVTCNGRALTYVPESSDANNDFVTLDLSKNNIVDLSAECFKTFPKLTKLDLRYNYIRNIYAMTFDGLSNLKIIQFDSNFLEKIYPLAFNYNPSLIHLSLSSNPIDLTAKLPMSDSIKHLDLSRCRLKSIPPDTFADHPQLEVVNLNHNALESLPLDFFDSFSNLKNVYLHGNLWGCDGEMKERLLRKQDVIVDFRKLMCTTPEGQQKVWFPEVPVTTTVGGIEDLSHAFGSARPMAPMFLAVICGLAALLQHAINVHT